MKKIDLKEKLKKVKISKPGKRQLVLCGLILMIAIAGYINLNYEETSDTIPVSAPVSNDADDEIEDVFANSAIEKNESRSSSMDIYREIIDNPNSSEEAKAQAEADLSACAKAIENETILENMIKSKGFDEAVVYIATDSVNVVVKTDGLVPSQVAQIKDLVVETTGFEASRIKIAEIN